MRATLFFIWSSLAWPNSIIPTVEQNERDSVQQEIDNLLAWPMLKNSGGWLSGRADDPSEQQTPLAAGCLAAAVRAEEGLKCTRDHTHRAASASQSSCTSPPSTGKPQ